MEDLGFGEQPGVAARRPGECLSAFRRLGADTHCGSECRKILDLAAPLLEAADPAARPDLWRVSSRRWRSFAWARSEGFA